MPKPKAAPRTSPHLAECPWCALEKVGRARLLGGLLAVCGVTSLSPIASGAPNPEWPPKEQVALSSLAKRDFWPSDVEYGYSQEQDGASRDGQFWLYSFVPQRSTDSIVLRQPNLAAGLSVDAAWRFTQGMPNVVLAFLDDGINLTETDLVENVFLNVGELLQTPPVHSDGKPCDRLDPTKEDSPRFDCAIPKDGVATLDDYRERFGWIGDQSGLDPNGNGRFDVEDLISELSNATDDDGNGFVDDIAGWDFVDFDNLPIPENATGGTQSALDAVSAANNDLGGAGVCPKCRALPIRIGHQRGSSPQLLALGLLYASSMGATASLMGHLPAGRARILDAALKIGSQRNHLVFLPRDGEQQRSAEILFDSDTARTIGTLTLLGGTTMSTGSFVANDPCQTSDADPVLMAAAPACSRRGPAIALGVAGLVSSFAKTQSETAQLSAQELRALLEHSSDRVVQGDAPTTLSPNTDESTTVARLNANKAIQDLRDGIVPPELDIERPRQLETLIPDSVSLQIPVIGRTSSARYDSYDVLFEVALGEPKSQSEFRLVGAQRGLTQERTFPVGSELGSADLRSWYESVKAENAELTAKGLLATLRVRVVATRNDTGQKKAITVESEVRRKLVIERDPSLVAGFPVRLDASPTSPKLADLNGDGGQEIVIGTVDGQLQAIGVLSGTPKDIFETSVRTRLLPAFQRLRGSDKTTQSAMQRPLFAASSQVSAELGTEAIVGPAAIGDIDKDGLLEIAFSGETGRLYVVRADGMPQPGWPRCVDNTSELADCPRPSSLYQALSSAPVLADVDGDTYPELVVAANNGKVYAFEHDGRVVGTRENATSSNETDTDWPVTITAQDATRALPFPTSPAVADMNGDQIDDLVLSSNHGVIDSSHATSSAIVILGAAKAPPSIASNWPIAVESYDFQVDRLTRESPPPAIDAAESSPSALLYGNATIPYFVPVDPGGETNGDGLPQHAGPASNTDEGRGFALNAPWGADSKLSDSPKLAPLDARPALADLDRDGKTDIVLPSTTSRTIESLGSTQPDEHRSLLVMWNGDTGRMLPASPIPLGDLVGSASPAIADLNDDSYPEVIMPAGDGSVVAVDACGRSPEGWPKYVGGRVSQSPAVGDLDNDGTLEVVIATNDGRVFAFHTTGKRDGYIPWESAQKDNMNRSAFAPDVQTAHSAARRPLPVNAAGHCLTKTQEAPAPANPELAARGGCACAQANANAAWNGALLLGLIGASLRRRRRSTVS